MKVDVMSGRIMTKLWLAALVFLVGVVGCSAPYVPVATEVGPEPAAVDTMETFLAVVDTFVLPPPPPIIVPVGIDTTFAERIDAEYKVIFTPEDIVEIEEAAAKIEMQELAADTVASVVRFLEAVSNPDLPNRMTSNDSAYVGRIILQAMVSPETESLVKRLDQIIVDLQASASEVDSVRAQLNESQNGAEAVQLQNQFRIAALGFSEQGQMLQKKLNDIVADLDAGVSMRDSLQSYRAIRAEMDNFGAQLANSVRETGQIAYQLNKNATITQTMLRQFESHLFAQREKLLVFRATWSQFESVDAPALANPQTPYSGSRIEGRINKIDSSYESLANQAETIASVLDTVATDFGKYEAGEQARDYIDDMLKSLIELKDDLDSVKDDFATYGNRYWQPRINSVKAESAQRSDLFLQLQTYTEHHGDPQTIRTTDDLREAYGELSTTALLSWESHLKTVMDHDAYRENTRGNIAKICTMRAEVLGRPQDYNQAREAYAEWSKDLPGDLTPDFEIARLYFNESEENDRTDLEQADHRRAAMLRLDACEELLRERFQNDNEHNALTSQLSSDEMVAAETIIPDTLALGDFPMPEEDFYFKKFFPVVKAELVADSPLLASNEGLVWMRAIESLRAAIVLGDLDGPAYFHHAISYLYLRPAGTFDAAKQVEDLKNLSMDEGNLALRKRWGLANAMADSIPELASVKRDTFDALYAAARTTGARRFIMERAARIEFDKLDQYDRGIERLYKSLADIALNPNPNPEFAGIDSTITEEYPRMMFYRAGKYLEEEKKRDAFLCYLVVATEYSKDNELCFLSFYQASSIIYDSDRQGAYRILEHAVDSGIKAMFEKGENFDSKQLIIAMERQAQLAKRLRLTQDAKNIQQKIAELQSLIAEVDPSLSATDGPLDQVNSGSATTSEVGP